MKTILSISILLMLVSCSAPKPIFTRYTSSANDLLHSNALHKIHPDDKLAISVWSHDELSVGSVFSIYNSNESYGKWIMVDSSGYAVLPKLGHFHVNGLSCTQFQDTLKQALSKNLVDPVVVVKVLNREATILGEIKTPGNYILEKEQTRLIDLIGKAEGMTDYADLRKIQVIRQDTSYFLNLKDTIQYYDIQILSGDLVNIPAKKSKRIEKKAPTIIPFASAITAIAVLFSVLSK